MLADTYFVDADRKAYWIPFPTGPQLVEYDLPADGPPSPRRTIELDSLQEAAASFFALVELVRSKRYWSLMPWTLWAKGDATRRLMLPNVGGTAFLSTPDGPTSKLAQGPVQHVASAIGEAVVQLREAGFSEVDVQAMWSETRSRLETVYTFVERETDGGTIQGFVVPGSDALVGPRLVRAGDRLTVELAHGDAVLERRVFVDGRLETYTSSGSGGACLRWKEQRLRDVLLYEWGGCVCLTTDDDDRPAVAGFDAERMTDVATFEGGDFRTFARLGVDGPDRHELEQFTGDAPNRFVHRAALTGALSCPVPCSLDEAVELTRIALATLASGKLERTEEPSVAVLTQDFRPQFGIYGADQWKRASAEPIAERKPTVVPLSTAQRDTLVALFGRCRNRNERSTTAYPFQPSPEDGPSAAVPAEDAAAILVHVRLDGFQSPDGLTLAERESGDVGLFLPERWTQVRERMQATIDRDGPVCVRQTNWALSRPFERIDDFLRATPIDAATLELIVSLNPRWKPSPYGCTVLFHEAHVVGTLELVAASYLAVHEQIGATDLALGLPEEGMARALVGWALPAKEVTPALLTEAIAARDRRLTDVHLAACDLVTVDDTAAVVFGIEIAAGLGLTKIPPQRIADARERAQAALAECPTWTAELEGQAPRIVVTAQGGLSRGELMVGTVGPEQSKPGLTYSRAHPTRDQSCNDESDEGVLGVRLAQAGPWRNRMADSVELPDDPATLVRTHAKGLESDEAALYLTYAYGN